MNTKTITRLYVVAERELLGGAADPNERVWTLSPDPEQEGWDTDSGYPRYGLTKAIAQWIADAANEQIARDGAPTFELEWW